MEKGWYVVRVQTGKESAVRESLEKQIKAKGLASLITHVLVPTEKVSEIRRSVKKVIEKKLYPGYLMIEMEMNDETKTVVRETPGIGEFVGSRLRPTAMADYEVEKMLRLEQAKAEEKPMVKIGFKKGDGVRVKDGPFENFDGVVDEIIPAKGIVKVIVTVFGRATPLELEYWQIEAA